ncbi:MAG: hypothetical protein OEV08_08140 [Nitrospira sp.]|nr:hypothetical protein [Nitrospira sp.]
MYAHDSLLLEAKQAILDEQYRRFQALQAEGKWQDAMLQFQTTLTCASSLLQESLALLEQVVARQHRPPDALPPGITPPQP